ncbi:MAG: fumarylacetoacetate hydrolase family protein [Anaerolineales bacterium]|nr:fumarylacetoacetate hydrolase family protein [Anaerolineales bacterium]
MGFRLATIAGRAVLLSGNHYYDLERVSNGRFSPHTRHALAHTDDLHAIADGLAASLGQVSPDGTLDGAAFDPPVLDPNKVFAIGLNYRAHAHEANLAIPSLPMVFTKFQNCLAGSTAVIELGSDTVDWEVELVVVIGKGGRHIAADDAWNHVAGLTIGQDLSDRVVQFALTPPQFSFGKSNDTYGPIGPAIVSPDLLPDPNNLAISCQVNGHTWQNSRTNDFIFSIPEIIAYLSAACTLTPGDLIFTGTPAGIGMPSQTYLKDGDEITSTIEGLGSMVNRCRRM